MLIISPAQREALSPAAYRAFETRMLEHVGELFPETVEALGASACRGAIRHGIIRGREHGFVSERDLCKYIDLMFVFGRDFDSDPELPWVSPILRDGGQPSKIEALLQAAQDHTADGEGLDHAPV